MWAIYLFETSCLGEGIHSTECHSSLNYGGYVRRQKANGRLEKTAGWSWQRLQDQQGSGGCQRSTAIYAVIWNRQGSRRVATYYLDPQAAAVSRRTEYFLQAEKPPKKLRLSWKTAEIYFSASRRKNFSLNLHYDDIIFDSPGITLPHRQVIKCLNKKKWKWKEMQKLWH